jgi:hypothetical protein
VFGRGHDVSEEHGHRQHIAVGSTPGTGQELIDLVHHSVGVTHEKHVVVAGEDDETGVGDMLGEVAASTQMYVTVSLTVQDQGRDRYGGQKPTYIRFVAGPHQDGDLIGACAESGRACQPGLEAFVGDPAGGDHLRDARPRTPRFFDGGNKGIEILRRNPPGVVVFSHEVGTGVE